MRGFHISRLNDLAPTVYINTLQATQALSRLQTLQMKINASGSITGMNTVSKTYHITKKLCLILVQHEI